MKSGSLSSLRLQSDLYKSAKQEHDTAQAKLSGKSKPSKSKLAALQKDEGEARSKAEEKAKLAVAAAKAAEADHAVNLHQVVRDAAFSQVRAAPSRFERASR